jgi:DNA-binding XRE family transcriptional regulator
MDTASAVTALRSRLQLSREKLGALIGRSGRSIHDLESGVHQASSKTYLKLAKVARDAGAAPLADFFDAARIAKLSERASPARNTDRIRRISLYDLKSWSAQLKQGLQNLQQVSERTAPDIMYEYLRLAAWTLDQIRDEIEATIDEPYSIARIEEDQQLIKTPPREKVAHGKKKS